MNIDKKITLKAKEIIEKCVYTDKEGKTRCNCCYDDTGSVEDYYYSFSLSKKIDLEWIRVRSYTYNNANTLFYLYINEDMLYLIMTRDKELIKKCQRLLIIYVVRGMF